MNALGPTDTDDEEDNTIDEQYVDSFIINESINFSLINRNTLYAVLIIGDKLIDNMNCVLTTKERSIIYTCSHIIIYYIYNKSNIENKARNARNFLILLTSRKKNIKGVKSLEIKFLHSAILINQIDLFQIVLSYMSTDYEIDTYTEILSMYLVKDDTKFNLLVEFWKFMDLDAKYTELIKISGISLKDVKCNGEKLKYFISLCLHAAPNICKFLSDKIVLLKKELSEEHIRTKGSTQNRNKTKRARLE